MDAISPLASNIARARAEGVTTAHVAPGSDNLMSRDRAVEDTGRKVRPVLFDANAARPARSFAGPPGVDEGAEQIHLLQMLPGRALRE